MPQVHILVFHLGEKIVILRWGINLLFGMLDVKIKARLERVPYMLVVGAKEEEEGKVSVRSRYLGDEGMKDLGEFIAAIKEEIKNKTIRKIEVEEEKK